MSDGLKNSCLLFSGETNNKGYGYISHGGVVHLAHRLAWVLANGRAVPRGKVVMHRCDIRLCIEPTHLMIGAHQENINDMARKGRAKFGGNHRPTRITTEHLDHVNALRRTGVGVAEACKDIGISRAMYYVHTRRLKKEAELAKLR